MTFQILQSGPPSSVITLPTKLICRHLLRQLLLCIPWLVVYRSPSRIVSSCCVSFTIKNCFFLLCIVHHQELFLLVVYCSPSRIVSSCVYQSPSRIVSSCVYRSPSRIVSSCVYRSPSRIVSSCVYRSSSRIVSSVSVSISLPVVFVCCQSDSDRLRVFIYLCVK